MSAIRIGRPIQGAAERCSEDWGRMIPGARKSRIHANRSPDGVIPIHE
jgi:hypothetical protein